MFDSLLLLSRIFFNFLLRAILPHKIFNKENNNNCNKLFNGKGNSVYLPNIENNSEVAVTPTITKNSINFLFLLSFDKFSYFFFVPVGAI